MMGNGLTKERFGYTISQLRQFMSLEELREHFDLFGRYDLDDPETAFMLGLAARRRRFFEETYGVEFTNQWDTEVFWYY